MFSELVPFIDKLLSVRKIVYDPFISLITDARGLKFLGVKFGEKQSNAECCLLYIAENLEVVFIQYRNVCSKFLLLLLETNVTCSPFDVRAVLFQKEIKISLTN